MTDLLLHILQGQLFPAMRRTRLIPDEAGWQSLIYSRCGRTDKGVSALAQVCLAALFEHCKIRLS